MSHLLGHVRTVKSLGVSLDESSISVPVGCLRMFNGPFAAPCAHEKMPARQPWHRFKKSFRSHRQCKPTMLPKPRLLPKPRMLFSGFIQMQLPSSSVASKADFPSSMDCTRPLTREGRMVAHCTGRVVNVAMRHCALNTLKADGASRSSRIEAAVYAVPMSKAVAYWRTVACAYGRFMTAEISSSNRARRW